jgi:hypothetical protein
MLLERRLAGLAPDEGLVHQRNSRVFDLVGFVGSGTGPGLPWKPLKMVVVRCGQAMMWLRAGSAVDSQMVRRGCIMHRLLFWLETAWLPACLQVREAALGPQHWEQSYQRLAQVSSSYQP